jgi:acetylornithine/succinyldiaminopimelate/putrescine aminotransferase
MSVTKRQLFLNHVAQTSPLSLMLEVHHASGMYIYDESGKAYLDLNSGISVSSLGHCHPKVVQAIQEQAGKYMHTMVYGEHVQSPQTDFARLLVSNLDKSLDNIYFLNGGSEAVEAAMKLVRRFTGRPHLISCANAYHGSTLGAESLRSDTSFTQAFLPGIPGISHIQFNNLEDVSKIDGQTAGVFLEPVQAEAGVIPPDPAFLSALRKRCSEVGALLVFDEIQTGFGRTGHLFAHQKYQVLPDVLLIGKSMGGGMPISGVVSSKEIMQSLTKNPSLGHITTFGGHPVTCAAAHASLQEILDTSLYKEVEKKEKLIHELLEHPIIKEVRSSGLMMAVELTKRKYLKHVVSKTLELGAIVDYFLFNNRSFRLAPPLIINEEEIRKGCTILLQAMDYASSHYG